MDNQYTIRQLPNSATGCTKYCRDGMYNTCYANSVFQSLISLPDIRYYCLTDNEFPDNKYGMLKGWFTRFVRKYLADNDTEYDSIRALCIRQTQLMKYLHIFDKEAFPINGTAGAADLIRNLIESLDQPHNEPITKLFQFGYQFLQDGNTVNGPVHHDIMITLDVVDEEKRFTKFSSTLRQFITDRNRTKRFTQLPKYTIVNLNRMTAAFVKGRLVEKYNSHVVDMPEFVDFGTKMGLGHSVIYHLNNRINYNGVHYTADVYARNFELDEEKYSWYHCNDCHISPTNRLKREVNGTPGLIYIYKRLSPSETRRYLKESIGREEYTVLDVDTEDTDPEDTASDLDPEDTDSDLDLEDISVQSSFHWSDLGLQSQQEDDSEPVFAPKIDQVPEWKSYQLTRRHWVESASSDYQPTEPSPIKYESSKKTDYHYEHARDLDKDHYDPSGCTYQSNECLYRKSGDSVDHRCEINRKAKSCRERVGCSYQQTTNKCTKNKTGRVNTKCQLDPVSRECSLKPTAPFRRFGGPKLGCTLKDGECVENKTGEFDPTCRRMFGKCSKKRGCDFDDVAKTCNPNQTGKQHPKCLALGNKCHYFGDQDSDTEIDY